ncbi:MAG: riboflavin synthase, partial [Methylophilus sp.]
MFTGIIQTVGHIADVVKHGDDCALRIEASDLGLQDVQLGDSIAVNGVCLTV